MDKLKQYALEHMAKHSDKLSVYTDGSKSENGVGFAVISNNFKIQASLPPFASIYTAEIYAIKYALINIDSRHLTEVVIYSDSQSAIQAIRAYYPENALISDIQYLLHKLSEKKISVVLCWIPGHVGIEGNEKADKAAKEAITFPMLSDHLPIEDIKYMLRI